MAPELPPERSHTGAGKGQPWTPQDQPCLAFWGREQTGELLSQVNLERQTLPGRVVGMLENQDPMRI